MATNNETTTKFKVDISELKSAMQDAKRQIALANSEFKAASSGMNNWAKSSDGLSAKIKQLDSNLKSQKSVLTEYERILEKVKKEYGDNSKEAQEWQTKVNNQKAVVNRTEKDLRNYTEAMDELGEETEDAGESAEKSSGGFTVMKGALASLVADGIRMAISALKDMASAVIETGSNFSSSMAEVQAISGATGEDLALLEATAREFGATSVFSASEAADALKYMSLAGWDAQTSASALGGVLNLAASAGMDLAQASDMVTDYMSAFGMEASQSAYFADLLAYAQSNSNTSAEQLGEAFKNCAANLNAGGQDVETTTSLLAAMANQGLKGSEAGTALTAVMRDMTAKMKDGKIAIGKTSVEVMDANGNYRDMTDILKDVEAATNGLGDAEKATALLSTFTADSIKGLNLILNDGVGNAEAFEEALRNSGGTAEEMAKIMNDNLAGDVKTFHSALEELSLKIYDVFEPALRSVVQAATDLINGVEGAGDKLGDAIGAVLDTALSKLTGVLPEITGLVTNIINQLLITIMNSAPALTSIVLELVTSLINVVISCLPQLIEAAIGMLEAVLAGLSTALPQIVTAIVEIIPQIIDAIMSNLPTFIQACVDFLMAMVKALPVVIQALVKALPQVVNSIVDGLLASIDVLIQGAITLLMALVDAIPLVLPLIIDALPQIIDGIINGLIEARELIVDGGIQLLMALIEAIPVIVTALADALPQIMDAIVSTLIDNIPLILSSSIQVFMAIVKAIPQVIVALVEALAQIRSTIIDYMTTLLATMAGFAGQLIANVVTWGAQMVAQAATAAGNFLLTVVNNIKLLPEQIWTWLTNVLTKVTTWGTNLYKKALEIGKGFTTKLVDAVKDLPSKFETIGKNIVEGIWRGINSGWNWLTNQVKNLAQNLLKAAKDALDINSPSKEFEKQVGKWIPAGIAVGIDKNAKTALNSVRNLTADMLGTTSQSLATATGGLSGGGTVYNFYQTNNSPKALSRLDIYRQSKNLLGYAGGGY